MEAMPRIYQRTGRMIPCFVCGEEHYRPLAYLARGHTRMTCKSKECKRKAMQGANNPFWGKEHSPETLARIEATIKARPTRQRKGGPPKGWTHTPEQKAKMAEALKERWRLNRDKMLASLPRGEDHFLRKTSYEPRYRSNFSASQRKEWMGERCLWCDAIDDLVLDHIIPVMAGGTNVKENSQTLCQPCNLWKAWNVDRPLKMAGLGSQGGRD